MAPVSRSAAVISTRIGFRKTYVLILGWASRTLTVLPLRKKSGGPETVDRSKIDRWTVVCEAVVYQDSVRFEVADKKFLRRVGNPDTIHGLTGLEAYPFVSQPWPTLALMAALRGHRRDPWGTSDVLSMLAEIAASEGSFGAVAETEKVFLDACRLGLDDEYVKVAGLPETRTNWLRALAASASGNHERALLQLAQVHEPSADGAAALCCAALQSGMPFERVQECCPGVLTGPVGELLLSIKGDADGTRAGMYAGASVLTQWLADESLGEDAAASFRDAEAGRLRDPSVLSTTEGFRLASLVERNGPVGSVRIESLTDRALRSAPLAAIDELLEQCSPTDLDLVRLYSQRAHEANYLRLRADPACADMQAVIEGGHEAERIRRTLLVDPSDEDPAVQVMRRLCDGAAADLAQLEALPASWRETARDLSQFFETGSERLAEQLAGDPTLLPVIEDWFERTGTELPRAGALGGVVARGRLQEAFESVSNCEWRQAAEIARDVLRLTIQEDLRDEALNVLACAQWQLGEDDRAISALQTALEGAYNTSLQVNIGVVAASLEPETAAEHLGRLADEAPSVELRVEAVMRGLGLWRVARGQEQSVPGPLRDAARKLIGPAYQSRDLTDEKFWSLLETMCAVDSEWLASCSWPEATVPVRAEMKKVALAQSENPIAYVKAVGELDEKAFEWCRHQQNSIVDWVLYLQGLEPSSLMAVVMGMALLETGIDLPVDKEVRVRCFTAVGACGSVGEDEEPSSEIVDGFFLARQLLSECEPVVRADLEVVVNHVGGELSRIVLRSRFVMLEKVGENLKQMAGQLVGVPRHRIDGNALRGVIGPMRELCRDTRSLVDRFRLENARWDADGSLHRYADSVTGMATAIEDWIQDWFERYVR